MRDRLLAGSLILGAVAVALTIWQGLDLRSDVMKAEEMSESDRDAAKALQQDLDKMRAALTKIPDSNDPAVRIKDMERCIREVLQVLSLFQTSTDPDFFSRQIGRAEKTCEPITAVGFGTD